MGEWDLRAAVVTGRVNRVFRYADQAFENCARKLRELQKHGKNVIFFKEKLHKPLNFRHN